MNRCAGWFRWVGIACASFVVSGLASAVTASPSADQTAIIAAREQSNAGIAAHDAVRATQSHMKEAMILASTGGLFGSAEAMRSTFARTFTDPNFVTFVRTTSVVNVGGSTAAEHGRWVGRWRTHEIKGDYLATWSNVDGRWLIRSELFVPLGCTGAGCSTLPSPAPKR